MKKIAVAFLLVVVFLTTACINKRSDEVFNDNSEFYTIKMYMMVNSPTAPPDLPKVKNAINRILQQEINAEVDLIAYNVQEYIGKMNNIVANDESFDLIWTDYESYYRYLEMEALYPLNYVLDKYGSDIKNLYPEQFWQQVTNSDNKIYAVMNNQILPRSFGVEVRDYEYFVEFMADKNYNEADFADLSVVGALDVLEEYMTWLKTNKNGAGESAGGITYGFELAYLLESLGFDTLGGGMTVPGVVKASAEGAPTVVNQFETEEFQAVINRMVEWYQKGYIPKDITQGNYGNTNLDVLPTRTWKPGEHIKNTIGGVERTRTTVQFGQAYYLQNYIMGTMWGIGANSQNPARTMKFLNLMFTDARIHNLLKIGIEGEHYEVVDGKAAPTQLTSRYNLDNVRWTFGNELIGIPVSTQPIDVFEQVKQINKNTPLTKVIGFRFDRSSVETEIQTCSAIAYSALSALGNGSVLNSNPNAYQKLLTDLNAAGANKIIAEKQRQLNVFLAK